MKFDDLFNEEESGGLFEQEETQDTTLIPEENLEEDDGVEKEVEKVIDFEETDKDLFENENENEVKETDPTSKKNITNTKNNFILSLSTVYKEEGLISDFDEAELTKIVEEEGEVAGLKYLNDLQRDVISQEMQKNYSEDKNELEEYFKLKDLGVDDELAKKLIYNKGTFDNVTEEELEENEDLRRKILHQNYKNNTSFSESKIKKEIDKTIMAGDDIEEAMEALSEVKNYTAKQIEAEKLRIKEEEKAAKENIINERKSFKELVNNTDEIFEGQKLTKALKDKITAMVLEPSVKLENGQQLNAVWAERMKDPKKFEMLLAYHIATGTFYGKTDTLDKKAKTKAANKLEEIVKSTATPIKGGKSINKQQDGFRVQDWL